MYSVTTMWLFGFISTALSSVFWSRHLTVIEWGGVLVLALITLPIIYQPRQKPLVTVINGSLFATVWLGIVWLTYLTWQLPTDKIQQDVTITGEIISKSSKAEQINYTISVDQVDNSEFWLPTNIRVWSKTKGYPVYESGQYVHLHVKLKPTFGLFNPGAFDYQRWLASQRVVATGYIVEHVENQLIAPNQTLRYRLQRILASYQLTNEPWIQALMFGDRSGFDRADWTLLQHTGTSHLFSISGLHVGVVFGWLLFMCRLVIWLMWFLLPRSRCLDVKALSYLIASSLLFGYLFLVGFQVPVVRAWCLVAVYALTTAVYRHLSTLCVTGLMTCAIIVLFPHSLLGTSAYLSICAVAVIWLMFWRWDYLHSASLLTQLIAIQLGLSVALMPITLLAFGSYSFISIAVNLVAVPVVSLIIVPLILLCLVALLIGVAVGPVLAVIDGIFGLALAGLNTAASFPLTVTSAQFDVDTLLLALALLVIGLIPAFPYHKWLVIMAGLSAVVTPLWQPEDWWQMHVIDVGQGTAVLVTSKRRGILVDTGASYRNGSSAVVQQVIPVIQYLELDGLDYVVVSHDDDDHAGGLEDLIEVFPDTQVIHPQHHCVQGNAWVWQGLKLQVLWPIRQVVQPRNNDSCVLLLSDGTHSVLLPGDIERPAEYALFSALQTTAVDVVIMPHHGSNTSSSWPFVKAVRAEYAIATQGRFNRWHFPSETVVKRYEALETKVIQTSQHGYIKMSVSSTGAMTLETAMTGRLKRWFHREEVK